MLRKILCQAHLVMIMDMTLKRISIKKWYLEKMLWKFLLRSHTVWVVLLGEAILMCLIIIHCIR
jgi:hypothetical protein